MKPSTLHGARFDRAFACLALASALSGCSGEATLLRLSMPIVTDQKIFGFIRSFRVHVVSERARNGAPVTCTAIPTTFPLNSPQLDPRAQPKALPWSGQPQDAQIPLVLPVGEPLIVAVVGLDEQMRVIARGCAPGPGNPQLIFTPGPNNPPVVIDARPVIGAPCANQSGCEPGLTCHTGADFTSGYCTITGCASGAPCPTGSQCINDGLTNGICARSCGNLADCEAGAGQDCVGRIGLAGCQLICARPTWNQTASCR